MRSAALLATLALLFAAVGCSGSAVVGASPQVVDTQAAVALLDDRDDLTIIDVRTPEEYASGHIVGAELVDVQAPGFEDRIAGFDPSGAYVIYCRVGNRSAVAAEIMDDLGFEEVYDAGGFDELASSGLPTSRS